MLQITHDLYFHKDVIRTDLVDQHDAVVYDGPGQAQQPRARSEKDHDHRQHDDDGLVDVAQPPVDRGLDQLRLESGVLEGLTDGQPRIQHP
jgi:hypothetical protein